MELWLFVHALNSKSYLAIVYNMNKMQESNKSLVRSSAAEYLTFIAAHGEGGVEAIYADENIWLTQKMMGMLYNLDVRTINYHLKKIFIDSELEENSVIRNFRITAVDGKKYNTKHYNLSAIIALGYKVNSERAVQFRKWATTIISEFTIKGFSMDDDCLKKERPLVSNCHCRNFVIASHKFKDTKPCQTGQQPSDLLLMEEKLKERLTK